MSKQDDYILVYQIPAHKDEGYDNGWHPVTYENGALVIYGSKAYAEECAGEGEVVVSLNIPTSITK